MFDSPLEWCSVCQEWVALDQTFDERTGRCSCDADACPLAALFRRSFDATPDPLSRREPATS